MSDHEPPAEAQPEAAAGPVSDSPWETLDYVPSNVDPANFAVEPLKYDSM
jgi:hypothetical protein